MFPPFSHCKIKNVFYCGIRAKKGFTPVQPSKARMGNVQPKGREIILSDPARALGVSQLNVDQI